MISHRINKIYASLLETVARSDDADPFSFQPEPTTKNDIQPYIIRNGAVLYISPFIINMILFHFVF